MTAVVNVHFIWLVHIKYLTLPATLHAWYTNNNVVHTGTFQIQNADMCGMMLSLLVVR